MPPEGKRKSTAAIAPVTPKRSRVKKTTVAPVSCVRCIKSLVSDDRLHPKKCMRPVCGQKCGYCTKQHHPCQPIPEKFYKVARDFEEAVKMADRVEKGKGTLGETPIAYDVLRACQLRVTKRLEHLMRKAPKDYKGKKLALLERLAVAAERTVKIGTHANRLEDLEEEWEVEEREFAEDYGD